MKISASMCAVLFVTGVLWGSICGGGFAADEVTAVGVDDYEARSFTTSTGDTIQYRLFVPRGYTSGTRYPLVLFHHGGGGSGNDNRSNLEGPCPMEWAGPERRRITLPLLLRLKSLGTRTGTEKMGRRERW